MNISQYKEHCCGCGECFALCPVQAITMKKDKGGFYYPNVDENNCTQCGKCVKHCTFNLNKKNRNHSSIVSAYALKHNDAKIRAESRSGGVFTVLSDIVLDSGGVIYGCKLLNNREAIHMRATTKEERNAFRGSKYIQSKTHDIFHSVRNDLEEGLWVLFSGTACQVNAISDFCKGVEEKLLLVDIVCHGVPSPKVWQDYLDYLSKKKKRKIVSVDFRDKKNFGWAEHKETIYFDDGSLYSGDVFTQLFYTHLILRRDCFACPYKNLNRVGDISIADCWGITKHYPEFDDDKGVSLVLVNTPKGLSYFENFKQVTCIPVEIEKVIQSPLKGNWDIPKLYSAFWEFYRKNSLTKVVDKFLLKRESKVIFVKRKIYAIVKAIRSLFKR